MKKRTIAALGGIAGAVAGAVWLDRKFSAPKYRGAKSNHFDGEEFHNLVGTEHGPAAVIRWMMTRDHKPWPKWIDGEQCVPPQRVDDDSLRVTLVNHSTVLLQTCGLNILTDPIWSDRASPVKWAGPRRRRAPGVAFDDLPEIDVVVLSHNHYDHLDVDTLRALIARDKPRVIVPLGNAAFFEKEGLARPEEHEWWDSMELNEKVSLTVVPAQHFSGRAISDRDGTLWCGYVFEAPAGPVYFAGDTGWGPHFEMMRERFGPMRLSLLPVGAFRPIWFMAPVHISPVDAVRAHVVLESRLSIPIHHGTFDLGDDGWDEPIHDLNHAVRAAEIEDRFIVVPFGDHIVLEREAEASEAAR